MSRHDAQERIDALVARLDTGCPEESVRLMLEIADLYEKELGKPGMARRTLEAAKELEVTDDSLARDLAERLGRSTLTKEDALIAELESQCRWPDVIAAFQRRAEASTDTAERVACWLRMATIFLERFANVAEAAAAYERVLAIDPGNAEARSALAVLLEKRRDWKRLIALHEGEGFESLEKIREYTAAMERDLQRARQWRWLLVAAAVLAALLMAYFGWLR